MSDVGEAAEQSLASTQRPAGLPACCLNVSEKAVPSRAAVSARVGGMTTQTAEFQERYVLTSDANGITTYNTVASACLA